MNNDTVKEIDVLYMARKTRFLGIAILLGVFLVFVFGILVSKDNINKDLEYINYFSFIFCVALCASSVFLKKKLFQKVTLQNAATQYLNSHVLPFGLCDLGGLICIMSNLFINQNLVLAAAGFLITAAAIVFNFPKDDDYLKLRS
ncbi:MAG: hypothetical protein PHN88_11040 [Ignavibacteria bacterium]|nr:hypothetical protein [Ignavibacteria bacterium]